MTIAERIDRQRDFSGGQVMAEARRRDDLDVVRASCRTLRNFRILGSAGVRTRPGSVAVALAEHRVEEVRLSATEVVLMVLDYDSGAGSGRIRILTTTGTQIGTTSGLAWTASTVSEANYAVVNRDIVVTFPAMRPKVVRVPAGLASATFSDFSFQTTATNQTRQPFYRFPDTLGITLVPSARSGTITLTASSALFQAGHVGTRLRWGGRQVEITAFTSSTVVTAVVREALAKTALLSVENTLAGVFQVGDAVAGATSNAGGVIAQMTDAGNGYTFLYVIVTKATSNTNGHFQANEQLVGPNGAAPIFSLSAEVSPVATTFWDEALISSFRGWPGTVAFDRSRLIFADLAQAPEAVAWSRIAGYDDFYPEAASSAAMVEFVPGKGRVHFVTGGADQFVFAEHGVFYIPISASNPLKPGSVEFREISSEGVARVQPVPSPEGIMFVGSGRRRVSALIATGQSARPYLVRDSSKYHDGLFSSVKALAMVDSGGDYPERYVYALNEDGSVAVGRFEETREWIGWAPWVFAGTVKWIAGRDQELHLTCVHGSTSLVQRVAVDALTDCELDLDSIPSALAASPGDGPLWFLPSSTVALVRNGRDFGDRAIDADGNIVWLDGDDRDAAGWKAGLVFSCELEPFIRHADSGQSFRQSMRRRKLSQVMVTVDATQSVRVGNRWFSAVKPTDAADEAPPSRQLSCAYRQLGRGYDPRVSVVQERPGKVTVLEFAVEVTV